MEGEKMEEVYRECMRNHAATMGTYATDGCGEFALDESQPAELLCVACGCHRNFHRKVERRRRPRSRFTPEQKSQMGWFADRMGWRIPRNASAAEDAEVERFCDTIGVGKHSLKIWMQNHKGDAIAAAAAADAASSVSASDASTDTLTPPGTDVTGDVTHGAAMDNESVAMGVKRET